MPDRIFGFARAPVLVQLLALSLPNAAFHVAQACFTGAAGRPVENKI